MRITDALAARIMGLHRGPAPVELRAAPRGAVGSPVSWVLPNSPLTTEWNAARSLRGYELSTYAQRAVDCVAGDIAGLPFRAGLQRRRNTSSFDVSSPLAKLLGPAPGGPNPVWSAAMLWRYSIAQYLAIGKFAWAYEFDAQRRVVGLWPLMAQYLYPIAAAGGSEPFTHFEYGTKGSDNYREFRPDEIAYVWEPDLADWRLPHARLASALSDVEITHLLAQYDAAMLRNGNVPAHLIITPPFATPDDRAEFRRQFTDRFGGAGNAGKAAFAEMVEDGGYGDEPAPRASVDVKTIGTSARDSELSTLRESRLRDILVAVGVPLSRMGDASGRTFSNAAEESATYWRTTVKGLMQTLQDQVNTRIAPKVGNGRDVGWFDTSEVPELAPRPRRFTDEAAAQAAVAAGLITLDEYREDRSLPPAADVGLVPEDPEPDPEPTPADPEPSPADPEPGTSGEDSAAALARVARRVLEASMATQARTARDRLSGRRGRKAARDAGSDARALYDTAYWAGRMAEDLGPVLTEMGRPPAHVRRAAGDVAAELFGRLMALPDASDADAVTAVFRAAPEWAEKLVTGRAVPVGEVEAALRAVKSGELTAQSVIEGWSRG